MLRHHENLFSRDGRYEFIVGINDTKAQTLLTSFGQSSKKSPEMSSLNVYSMSLKPDETKNDEMHLPNDKVYKLHETSEIASDPFQSIKKRLDALTSAVEQFKSCASSREKVTSLDRCWQLDRKTLKRLCQ